MFSKVTFVLALGAVITATAAAADAQTIEQIVSSAKSAAIQRAAAVENYTVVEDVNGVEVTTYYEKETLNGFPTFRGRRVAAGGAAAGMGRAGRGGRGRLAESPEDEALRRASALIASRQFVEKARLAGTETVDGKRTFKIVVDDLASLDIVRDMVGTNTMIRPKTMTMNLDAAQYVPLRMVMTADLNIGGGSDRGGGGGGGSEVTINVSMQDYRVVEGLLHPFTTVSKVEGLAAAVNMPPMSQAQLDQIKALLDQLPPDQRAAAQQAMNAVTQSDSGGGMQTTINVKSLRVNTGPPPV